MDTKEHESEKQEVMLFIEKRNSSFMILATSVMAPRKGSQPNCNAGKMSGDESCRIPLALLDLLLCEKSVNVL